MMIIEIQAGSVALKAELNDTPTSRRLLEILPCETSANTWGDEIYFEVPMEAALENDALEVVDPGTVGFWVEGNSLAIPFGPTPISQGDECRLAARVNIVGKVRGDPKVLKQVNSGDIIKVKMVTGKSQSL